MSSEMPPRDPEELEATGAPAHGEIAPTTTMGAVHLTVSDLGRSLDFYRRSIGLTVLTHDGASASLGVGDHELLALVEVPGAPSAAGYTGLYHFALLLPERTDLARWLAHAARDRVPLTGLSDHFVSEALYLSDPDGHGIEIYWDRPREAWEGQVAERMTTLPLDVDDLLGELQEPAFATFDRLPTGTVMGHVHLKVAHIPETIAFYRDVLGFALMAQLGRYAAFLGAGGYHHHLGANTWESDAAAPPPPGTAALRHVTIMLPDAPSLAAVIERVEHAGGIVEQRTAGLVITDPRERSRTHGCRRCLASALRSVPGRPYLMWLGEPRVCWRNQTVADRSEKVSPRHMRRAEDLLIAPSACA